MAVDTKLFWFLRGLVNQRFMIRDYLYMCTESIHFIHTHSCEDTITFPLNLTITCFCLRPDCRGIIYWPPYQFIVHHMTLLEFQQDLSQHRVVSFVSYHKPLELANYKVFLRFLGKQFSLFVPKETVSSSKKVHEVVQYVLGTNFLQDYHLKTCS